MSNKIKEGIETLKTKFRGSDAAKAEDDFIRSGAADFGDSIAAEGGRRAVVRQVMKNNSNYFGLPPEMAESIAKSKDLGKGGSQFPDPLIVFRNKGNFTNDELAQIDEIIESSPFDDVKNIADKVSDYLQTIRPEGFTSGFAEGGRIGYRSGKSVKDGIAALLKLGNKKFGKDTIKVADDIEPSEFSKFNERNKLLDDADVEMYSDELGDSETWYQMGMTVREADELVKARKAEQAYMFQQYKMGKLDPEAGSLSKGRLNLLRQRAEEAEATKDYRLFGEDEADELKYLEDYFEKDYLNFKAQQTDRKITQEEIERLKELNEKFAKGGLAQILEM